jgi:hypothetical protein
LHQIQAEWTRLARKHRSIESIVSEVDLLQGAGDPGFSLRAYGMDVMDVPYGRRLNIWVQMLVHSGSGRSGSVVIMLTKKRGLC